MLKTFYNRFLFTNIYVFAILTGLRSGGVCLDCDVLVESRSIDVVCSEIQTKHINTLCGQKVEFLNANTVAV
jgi:hypothetical protein